MRAILVLAAFAAVSTATQLPRGKYELFEYQPVASEAATAVSGNARFTVLTDRLIRMEYAPGAMFEDRATLAFLHRNTTVPKFQHTTVGDSLSIVTDYLNLTYVTGQPFTPTSLSVKPVKSDSGLTPWRYGQHDTGNLLGTIKSLDVLGVTPLNCTQNKDIIVHSESLHCEWGVVSRDGWSVINDTANQALTSGAEWWDGWTTDAEDLYFFGHGHDYRAALQDFTTVAGKIAMVPRSTNGIWWTRWYDLNAADVEKVVDDYESRDIPLDVFVLDMDWHTKQGWGGYSFDERLFPVPSDAMGSLKARGLHLACNLHDLDGVRSNENMYTEMAKALGFDTSSGATIPFSMVNKSYVYALEDIVLGDVVKQGMDFWWSDWQQGGKQGGCAGGKQNPTIWLDKQRGTEHFRRGESTRAVHLARWGGLGTHRYQVGFSGDVAGLTWANLAYQPYFSATGSNVGYGFWSHDIEGPGDDHEMYVRWVQWAAYSSVFRSHDRGMSAGGCDTFFADTCSTVRVWNVPTKYFEANREAMRAREELVPYIYTATRQAYDTGLGLTRPMYYDFPEDPMAYATDEHGNFSQYMLGDDLLVAPIVAPADNTSMTNKTMFVPVGVWYEQTSGMLYNVTAASTVMSKSFALQETPVFVRGGAVIPTRPLSSLPSTIAAAMAQYTTLAFDIYPGAASGSGSVYEDDGATTAYVDGAFAYTKLAYTRDGQALKATVSTAGTFPELPTTRDAYVLRIVSSVPPSAVTANGQPVPYARHGGANTWTYDGASLTTIINVANVAVGKALEVDVTSPALANADAVFSGVKGAMAHAQAAKRAFDATRNTPGAHDVDHQYLMDAAATGALLSYQAGTNVSAFLDTLTHYRSTAFPAAVQEVKDMEPPPPLPADALEQLYNDGRKDHVLCGTKACEGTNTQYSFVRVEGYQPAATDDGVVPLNDFWSAADDDNYVTTATATPSGYAPAVFKNGYVYASQKAGTVALELWYNDDLKDHMAVATDAGRTDAKNGGYTQVNATLGYVLTANPSSSAAAWTTAVATTDGQPLFLGGVQLARWTYAWALLQNTFK